MSPVRKPPRNSPGPRPAAIVSPRVSQRPLLQRPPSRRRTARELVLEEDASLLDIVDNVLNKGVVLSGDLTIALAQVDLIYARLSLLLCAADRVLPDEEADFMARHQARHARRASRRRTGRV